ncbi:ATP-binding protein [Streptomyces sp. P38-E01]|uniref:ATP-binding protein n=1 Tax=Streptomyces tardus TaxID=2780544 RepID=A0A949N2F9_9ACTN|nr:ATP-binding protein [Streptomyces tardus]MBU7598895.1 ATP-binding protein [Streptomyces tardus]
MGFCDLPLADKLCSVGEAVDFASDPGKAIGDWVAKSAGELAVASADLAATAVDSTTKVDLGASWFRDTYSLILPIGLVLLVATFCAQLVRAAMRRDGRALAQAFTGTAAGVGFAFCAIAVTTVAIEVVDALSAGLLKASGHNMESAVRRIVMVDNLTAVNGLGWLVMVLAALGASLGAILYWCVMMVRKVGILVLVTLAVFAGAGGGWEAARRWRRGWIVATSTLVASKLLMTVIFVLGLAALGDTKPKDGLSAFADVLAGTVIMAMILLTPYAVFKFVHWAADGADGETLHRAGGTGAQMARQYGERTARKGAAMVATAGASAGAGAAAQGPSASSSSGSLASHPTGSSSDSTSSPSLGTTAKTSLDKGIRSAPTNLAQEPGGAGPRSGDRSPPPTTSPPPQGAPASSRDQTGTPPPTGR